MQIYIFLFKLKKNLASIFSKKDSSRFVIYMYVWGNQIVMMLKRENGNCYVTA